MTEQQTTEAAEAPEAPARRHVETVTQYRSSDDTISEHESKTMAGNMLREKFRTLRMSMETDPIASAPVSVRLNADGSGWTLWDGPGKPDGQVITWSAEGTPSVVDPEPLVDGVLTNGGRTYFVDVPEDVQNYGGPLRIRHGMGGPVIVSVFGDNGPMGYIFTQTMTDDEEHMEVMAGAKTIRVVRDPKSLPPTE